MTLVGILYNPHKPAIEKYLGILSEKLAHKGIRISFVVSTEDPDFSSCCTEKEPVHYLLVLGGDGSVLRSMTIALERHIPVIGVNFGKFGFLTRFEMEAIINPSFSFEDIHILPRLTLEIVAKNGNEEWTEYALNDVVVHRPLECNIEHYQITVNGEQLPLIAGDGIIVSTPTGSTAYSLSAGGAIIYPQASVIQLTLLAPHTMANSPIVTDDRTVLTLRKNPAGTFTYFVDGCAGNKADTMVIKRSRYDFLLASPVGESLSAIISEKLLWGKRG
jgi:NAD+ kinase